MEWKAPIYWALMGKETTVWSGKKIDTKYIDDIS